MLLELVILLGVLWLAAYLLAKEKYKFFKKRGIPYAEPIFPLGSTWRSIFFRENILNILARHYNLFPNARIVGIYQITKATYLIRDPQIVNRILIKDFSHFYDRGIPVDEETNPLEGHLFNLSGSKWKTLRNKLSPTFTSGKLKGMYSLMDQCVESFISHLDTLVDQEIEIRDALCRLTTDVIGSCAFGIDSGAINDPNCEFRRMGSKIFNLPLSLLIKVRLRFLFPKLFMKMKFKTVSDDVSEFFFNVTKQNFEHRLKTGTKRNDFMQLLLQLREKGEVDTDPVELRDNEEDAFLKQVDDNVHDNSKLVFTDEMLTAQAFVFFGAGFETSATSLSFTVYHLSKNPQIQEKLRREVQSIKKKFGGFSYEALKDMKYLEACINEGMRMQSPITVLFRQCNKTLQLDEGLSIEKDHIVMIPVSALHKDPVHFPEPDTFRPERFIESPPAPGTFLPFGDGPRVCIAQRFAQLELKLVLAKLMDHYRIETCPKMKQNEPIQLKPTSFIPTPKVGIFCRLRKLQTIS